MFHHSFVFVHYIRFFENFKNMILELTEENVLSENRIGN